MNAQINEDQYDQYDITFVQLNQEIMPIDLSDVLNTRKLENSDDLLAFAKLMESLHTV